MAIKIFKNGIIHTLEDEQPTVQSVVIKEGRIIAVGDDILKDYVEEASKIIDLNGKCMIPGFYDSHGHFTMAGAFYQYMLDLSPAPIGVVKSVADCQQKLKDYISVHPNKKFILGWGYNEQEIAEKRHLTKADIDAVSEDRMVLILHASNHIAYANSLLLETVGYHKDTPNPVGGIIHKDPLTGELDGLLEERAYMEMPLPQEYLLEMHRCFMGDRDSIEYISEQYTKMGITTANEGSGFGVESLQMIHEAAESKQLKIRLTVNERYPLHRQCASVDCHPFIHLHGAKFLCDGSIQCYTAYVSQPYFHAPKDIKENASTMPKEQLEKIVDDLYAESVQPICHCNGDMTIELYLDAIEKAQKNHPDVKNLRPLIIHSQMATYQQICRMKQLGALPSFFHLHTYYWGDKHREIFLGGERAENLNPIHWAMQEHLPFTTHCDTPVVPQTPLLSIWSCVNRQTSSGKVLGSHQCVDIITALKAYTLYAAYQYHEDIDKGSIAVGKLADFTILAEDIYKCPKEKIKDIEVLGTIVDGEIVYKKVCDETFTSNKKDNHA